ncbi:sulfatase-like hydrolase/transferase [Bacillaceae bacterium SIJ1]|uniref:sulfatase-like hydrolase/transferase n=1 Tax=Litoribacterium kuwaitense TaxID=1398745 RepID=UPI0013EB38CA|nr:sulfatase-like hydrolase/transferase [Litoribacterium kuwaitense]NGP45298.1 sulfatase-like hydrolase/transferase [Litoribacterium kuwaitense]
MTKPNFIIFYCDDLGYGDLGCYGSEHVKTPNIDRLASEGVRFTNWYSNSPVCSPSRASLLTGKYPVRTGVEQILTGKRGKAGLSASHETLSSMFHKNGYKTAMFGKWHLGTTPETRPNAHGYDEFFGFHAGCIDYYSHIFYWEMPPVHDLWHNEEEVWHNGEYMTELIAEKAVDFIQKYDETDPFFLYVPFNAPHYPMHAPEKYMKRFDHLPWDRQVMAAMISAVDDAVGEVVNTLKRSGQYEDTVIFFSSDNGPSVEARNWLDGTEDLYYGGDAGIFRGQKGSLFDGGIREPAILSYPAALQGGQVSDELGVMVDILPTFLSFAGISHEELDIDGKDLSDMLMKHGNTPHDQVFWEYNGQLAVRQGDWKLIVNGHLDFDHYGEVPDAVHLSNVREDPGERNNVADKYPERMKQMKTDVEAWYAQYT